MKYVGISGYAGSGKDTAAEALTHLGWTQRGFADQMRIDMLILNPWIDRSPRDPIRLARLINRIGWRAAKDEYPEVRRLLQVYGTEVGRQQHGEHFWVKAALDKPAPSPLVLTDTRFKNEAQAIKDRGGIVIRVNRPGVGPANAHESETGLDDWPFDEVIRNDGTIRWLQNTVIAVVDELVKVYDKD